MNNKGFSLVELIVSFAVLSLVLVLIGIVIKSSANTYSMISSNINLQYESQLAMSQIQEYVIDCNGSVVVLDDDGNNILYIFNKRATGVGDDYDGYMFKLSADTSDLKLYVKSFSDAPSFNFAGADGQPMTSHVETFNAELSTDKTYIVITLTYKLGNSDYTGRQTIAFRNPVDTSLAMP